VDQLPQLSAELIGSYAVLWGGRILGAIVVFLVGRWITNMIVAWFGRMSSRASVDETLTRFLSSILRILLLVVVVLTVVSILGIPTTSFLAILGAAGLAVGLALKDSLANFSSGVMLVLFRPFRVGDWVEAGGVAGSVESIRIFNTVIKTGDNRIITVPNGLIYGGTITNYSAEETRRIDLTIGVSYDDDIPKAKEIIRRVLDADERILEEPAPAVMLMELADSSVNFAVRPWVKSADYWAVRSDLLEGIKVSLEAEGLSIPYPQRDLHIASQAANQA
jgi:small conductance mechanosensitive channel